MTITLDNKQIMWIKDKIDKEKAGVSSEFENSTHTIEEAKSAIDYYDFLNNLISDIGFTPVNTKDNKSQDIKKFSIPNESISTEDIGAPVIPEINSTKSTQEDVSVISSAQEQMTEAQEKAMEDIFDL